MTYRRQATTSYMFAVLLSSSAWNTVVANVLWLKQMKFRYLNRAAAVGGWEVEEL